MLNSVAQPGDLS